MNHLPVDLSHVTPTDLKRMSREELVRLAESVGQIAHDDRRENQLRYYEPVSEKTLAIHQSPAKLIGIGGGNRAGKTTTPMVEIAIGVTGVVPDSLRDCGIDWSERLKGPIQARIVCTNKGTTLYDVMLRKLIWNLWTGVPGGQEGGSQGHYGWIPRNCLIDGEWDRSWKDKRSVLTVLYRNPENPDQILGESSIQFMSHEQDSQHFESGDVSMILLDEPPPISIFKACRARLMSSDGRMFMAMTWPDRPEVAIDWVWDEVVSKGQAGPKKSEDVEWFEISSKDNPTINQEGVSRWERHMDDKERGARILGQNMRFANRIHPLFTDVPRWYCFDCNDDRNQNDAGNCFECGSSAGVMLCHVQEFEHNPDWPVIHVLDPHPRKAHMSIYVAVTPEDRYQQICDLDVKLDAADFAEACAETESKFGMKVVERLMDPRMGGSVGMQREHTWQDEFADVGLRFEKASPSEVGRDRFNTMLRPDPSSGLPSAIVHPRCDLTIHQLLRFMWDDWRLDSERQMKQSPKDINDDKPACWRYFGNRDPRYYEFTARPRGVSGCQRYGPQIIQHGHRSIPRSFRR